MNVEKARRINSLDPVHFIDEDALPSVFGLILESEGFLGCNNPASE